MVLKIENDPFPAFDDLLDKAAVSWNEDFNMWAITRFDDVTAVMADLDRFSVEHGYRGAKGESWRQVKGKPAGELSNHFLRYTDPPVWDKFRWLHDATLPYRELHGEGSKPQPLRERLTGIVKQVVQGSQPKGYIEAMQEWCQRLPCLASMAVLGLPAEDFEKLRDLTLDGILMLVRNPTDHDFWSDEAADKANSAAVELNNYLLEQFAIKRAAPADDMISKLISYSAANPQKGIGEAELIQVVANQMMGGFHESSMAVLADGLYLLLSTGQYKDIVNDQSLIVGAVEEMIRFHAFAPIAPRRAKVDMKIGGQQIKQDDLCLIYLGAAQRDPARYDNAREFDINRSGESNGDLSFGAGAHACPGQPLIRMLAQVFFAEVASLYPGLRLAQWPENHYMSLRYQPRADIVLLESLPLSLS